MTDIVKELRDIATGEKVLQYADFHPKDWRPGAINLLLWDAADEIERLRAQLVRANCPIVDCRNEGPRFRPAECGGFQGHED